MALYLFSASRWFASVDQFKTSPGIGALPAITSVPESTFANPRCVAKNRTAAAHLPPVRSSLVSDVCGEPPVS